MVKNGFATQQIGPVVKGRESRMVEESEGQYDDVAPNVLAQWSSGQVVEEPEGLNEDMARPDGAGVRRKVQPYIWPL